MTTPQQFSLGMRSEDVCPLAPIEAVMFLGRVREDDVLTAIEQGRLAWAFDIASPGAKRREIRILRDKSLAGYLPKVKMEDAVECTSLAQAVGLILPQPTPLSFGAVTHQTIRGVELARRFVCGQWLITNLLNTKQLTAAAISVKPKISPYIHHASAVEFLKSRLVINS